MEFFYYIISEWLVYKFVFNIRMEFILNSWILIFFNIRTSGGI